MSPKSVATGGAPTVMVIHSISMLIRGKIDCSSSADSNANEIVCVMTEAHSLSISENIIPSWEQETRKVEGSLDISVQYIRCKKFGSSTIDIAPQLDTDNFDYKS